MQLHIGGRIAYPRVFTSRRLRCMGLCVGCALYGYSGQSGYDSSAGVLEHAVVRVEFLEDQPYLGTIQPDYITTACSIKVPATPATYLINHTTTLLHTNCVYTYTSNYPPLPTFLSSSSVSTQLSALYT